MVVPKTITEADAVVKMRGDLRVAAIVAKSARPIIEVNRRFLEKVGPSEGPKGCRLWQGSRHRQGYGLTSVVEVGEHYRVGSHRVAYFVATGFWRWGWRAGVIRHLCHNPACCEPKHLIFGTRQDNAWDRRARVLGLDLVAIRRAVEAEVTA